MVDESSFRGGLPRALLVLGRVSNLPTVWANCLAGWWLSGGGEIPRLLLLMVGASLLYVGGMYLNDAFDAEFDRQHRQERPIPSGIISLGTVWLLGVVWLLLGLLCVAPQGFPATILALLLIGAILLYDGIHKLVTFSPVLMALCRLLLLLLAAACGDYGVTGSALWSALVLAGYIIGLSYLARRESTLGVFGFWPMVPLAAPVILAWIVNIGDYRSFALALIVLLALWVAKCLIPLWTARPPNIGRAVSGLLAGICLVDLLSVADAPKPLCFTFLALFGLSLLAQRYIPAT